MHIFLLVVGETIINRIIAIHTIHYYTFHEYKNNNGIHFLVSEVK